MTEEKDMRGFMEPFDVGFVAMQKARSLTFDRTEGPLIFNMRLIAHSDGECKLKGQWWGQIPQDLLDKAGHLLSDEERALGQVTKEAQEIKVPKIVQYYFLQPEPVRWTIVMAHMRNFAEIAWNSCQGSYAQVLENLETHSILEESEDAEQALFNKALAVEEGEAKDV